MKKLLLGLGLLSSLFVNAQSENYKGISYGFQMEYVDFQRGQFNTYLNSKSLEKGSLPEVLFGFNLNGKYGQHVYGIDYSINSKEEEQTNYRVKNTLSTVAFSYGYSLIKKDAWDLYPYIGYRLLNYNYTYEGFDQAATDFESYLTQNKAYVSLDNRMHGADLGIGFQFNSSFTYSLKIGTQLPYVSRRWVELTTEDKLKGGPHVKSLFYIKASVGFGEYKSKSKRSTPKE